MKFNSDAGTGGEGRADETEAMDSADRESPPLKIVTAESDAETAGRTKPLSPPPDYTSRAIRFRLLTLVVMLGLVIVAMREAGKPERWKWMGFDELQSQSPPDPSEAPTASPRSGEPLPFGAGPSEAPSDVSSEASFETDRLSGGASKNRKRAERPYPTAAVRFWGQSIPKMDSRQHCDLFFLLKSLRTGDTDGLRAAEEGANAVESRVARLQKLIKILAQQRQRFHRGLLDQIAVLPGGSEEKETLANELYESEQVWERKIFPAFRSVLAGDDFTVSQLRAVERLQRVLDPLVFSEVSDRTTIGWDGDSAAWVRMWELVGGGDRRSESAVLATHLQLSGQPATYRGRRVRVEGWVRAARRKSLPQSSELGVPGYYQLIVRPADSNVSPYYVYSLELPARFPVLGEQYSNMNQKIEAEGLFFKIRTYNDAGGGVSESPVLLSRSFAVVPDSQVAVSTVDVRSISLGSWGVIAAGLALVAGGIGWWAFRLSETRRYQPGQRTTEKINDNLKGLARDPNVKTEVEKVQELYD